MTKFLASVTNVQEASAMLAAGADIIDIKDPRKGALGAVEPSVVGRIVQNIAGRVLTSATIGDLPMQIPEISAGIDKIKASGVDIIKIGVFAGTLPASVLEVLRQYTQHGTRIVLVFFADLKPQIEDFPAIAMAGIHGVMLDTADKKNGSLRTILDDSQLKFFVKQAQSCNLLTGLAGSLRLGDIQPLLELNPDYLGFRGALCSRHQRNNAIDLHAAHNVRAMIPLQNGIEVENSTLMLSMNQVSNSF